MSHHIIFNNIEIYRGYPAGKELTSFKTGGNALYLTIPDDIEEIKKSILFAHEKNIPYFILGNGSNVLISDSGYKGLIISTKKLSSIEIKDDIITALTGIPVNNVCEAAIKSELSGIEFAYGLPASLGGAIFMNARCYGSEFSNIVERVHILDENLCEKVLSNNDIEYSYKKSIFMEKTDWFIYKIVLRLKHGDREKIKEESLNNFNDRNKKGQFDYPSAGCIFKNDYKVGIPSGKIIDELGLKGMSIGGASVFEKHSNFIINKNQATADDVVQLIHRIKERVNLKRNIKLETEIVLLGFDT